MKIGKLMCLALVFLMAALPVLAEETTAVESNVQKEYKVVGKTYPYLRQFSDEEDPEESEMILYFVNDGDIPYVSVPEYFSFLSGMLEISGVEGIEYTVESVTDSLFSVSREDNDSAMYVETDEDVIYFINLDVFTSPVGQKAAVTVLQMPEENHVSIVELDALSRLTLALQQGMEQVASDDAENTDADGETESDADETVIEEIESDPKLFTTSAKAFMNRIGSPVEFNMGEYAIDLIAKDGVCYIPFQTLNDMFMNNLYVQYFFNGKMVIGVNYGNDSLIHQKYDAEQSEFSQEFANFNFYELCFLLDNFYGLKSEHGIDDFGTLFAMNPDLLEGLTSTDPRTFDITLMQFVQLYFDDIHSGYLSGSILSGESDATQDALLRYLTYGPSTRAMLKTDEKFSNARKAVYRAWVPGYEEIGDTAFITFDNFQFNRSDESEYFVPGNVDEDNPSDTIELISYANREIKREGSPVKNIVIDLSNNGGGAANSAVFVISWFLGDAPIALRDPLTGAQTNIIYHADVDFDGTYIEEKDTVTKGYNLFCLISPSSFSCGNLVPAAFKSSGNVVLVGQKSGGGSCVVLPCTTASGAQFQISGTKQLAIIQNGSFYNIDQGIEPDVVLTKPESFYDREALVEYLKEIK